MAVETESNIDQNERGAGNHHEKPDGLEDDQLENEANLTTRQKLCFSVGHIQNDLQAYAAFSYFLVFLTKVIGLSSASTGVIFLVAQITDGALSPIIGYLCDRYELPFLSRFGQRKAWHILGTMTLLLSSPFLFIKCLPCPLAVGSSQSNLVASVYFCVIVIVIHFGFAAVQISHLALLPDIAKKQADFVWLNSTRTACTFVSGMFVYAVIWLLLGESTGQNLSSKHWREFMYFGFIIIAVGFTLSVIFYIGVNENKVKIKRRKAIQINVKAEESVCNSGYEKEEKTTFDDQNENTSFRNGNNLTAVMEELSQDKVAPNMATEISSSNQPTIMIHSRNTRTTNIQRQDESNGCTWLNPRVTTNNMKVKNWFRIPEFYVVGFIYMCSRVVVNMSSSYFPLYLVDGLNFEKEAIAYFPLLVLVFSTVFSWVARKIDSYWSYRVTYGIGAVMAVGAYCWFYFQPIGSKNAIYGASALMGGGSSMMLVTALTMTSVMIKRVDRATGAFVYGVMSFTDKVANGVVVAVVQNYYPMTTADGCLRCGEYIRLAFPLITGTPALLSLVVVSLYYRKDSAGSQMEEREIKINTSRNAEGQIIKNDEDINGPADTKL